MSPALQFLLVLVIILTAAKLSGLLATRLGQPAVFGEIAAGVLLGPTALDLFDLGFLSEPHLEETVILLGELGLVFLMFLAGLETDLDEVNRVRAVAITAGTLGVVVPLAMGAGATLPFGFSTKEAVFVGIILSATSVSISARTLMELGVVRGRQGISILAAAVIDDVLVLLILSFFVAFAAENGDTADAGHIALILGRVLLFFAAALVVGRLVLPRLARWASRAPMSEGVMATAIVVALLYAWFSEHVGGVALITGAFLAGLLLKPTELHAVVEEKMHAMSYAFFVPIFFISIGLSANARAFDPSDILLLLVLCAVAVLSKLLGSGIGARLAGESTRSSLQIGAGMVSRGEVGLIVASFGLAEELIGTDLFSVTVLMVLVSTLVAPLLLRVVFVGHRENAHVQPSSTGNA